MISEKKIINALSNTDLKMQEISDMTGISKATLFRIKKDPSKTRLENIEKLMQFFDIDDSETRSIELVDYSISAGTPQSLPEGDDDIIKKVDVPNLFLGKIF